MWPETARALGSVIGRRQEGLVFLTRLGNPWQRESITYENGTIAGLRKVDAICDTYGKLLKKLGQKRMGVNFYALRHTFRTVAAELKDENGVRWIMGHVRDDIDAEYIERLPLERLRVVTDHVHGWLYRSGK